jgi:hypothetical protein
MKEYEFVRDLLDQNCLVTVIRSEEREFVSVETCFVRIAVYVLLDNETHEGMRELQIPQVPEFVEQRREH